MSQLGDVDRKHKYRPKINRKSVLLDILLDTIVFCWIVEAPVIFVSVITIWRSQSKLIYYLLCSSMMPASNMMLISGSLHTLEGEMNAQVEVEVSSVVRDCLRHVAINVYLYWQERIPNHTGAYDHARMLENSGSGLTSKVIGSTYSRLFLQSCLILFIVGALWTSFLLGFRCNKAVMTAGHPCLSPAVTLLENDPWRRLITVK